VKHPIVGDPIYGQTHEDIINYLDRVLTPEDRIEKSGATRLLLHANELEFNLYEKDYHIVSKVDFMKEVKSSISTHSHVTKKTTL